MRLLSLALVCAAAGAAHAQELPTVVTRPIYLRVDGGFGAPTGIFGFSIGYAVAPPWSLELGGGLGASGGQLALLGRWYHPIGESTWHSWTLAGGPSLSFVGEGLGLHVPHADDVVVEEGDIYTIFGLNVEVGWEMRLGWGGLLRVALGGFLRVHENMSGLCPRETSGDQEGPCGSMHLPTAPEVARLRAYPYLVFGYGFAF